MKYTEQITENSVILKLPVNDLIDDLNLARYRNGLNQGSTQRALVGDVGGWWRVWVLV
jgi:hypothetical protein